MELAGSLKKIRVKLIMIGICLIFLAGYKFVKKKDHKNNSDQKKYSIDIRLRFLKKMHRQMRLQCISLLENPEKYGLKKSKNLYRNMKSGRCIE